MDERLLRVPSAILFDIGDTLIPASQIQDVAVRQTARWLQGRFPRVDEDTFKVSYSEADSQYDDPSTNHLWGIPLEIMLKACAALGVGRADALAAGGFYRQVVRRHIAASSELRDLFNDLRSRRIRVGVVSNGTTIEQVDTVTLLGVADFIQAFAISQDLGSLKIDGRLVEAALNELQTAPTRAWLVGDDAQSDGEAARTLGMVWVRVGKGSGEGDLNIASVTDLADVIRRLGSPPAKSQLTGPPT